MENNDLGPTIVTLKAEVDFLGAELTAAKAEIERMRAGGCARDQSTTQYCAEAAKLAAENEKLRAALDGAYNERNRLVAFMARLFPSGLKKTDIPGWDEAWHGCVYIDLPTGQASWHFHDREAHLFDGLPPYSGEWDGHNTDEKYERIARAALEGK